MGHVFLNNIVYARASGIVFIGLSTGLINVYKGKFGVKGSRDIKEIVIEYE